MDSKDFDCGDAFWSNACTKNYCEDQNLATLNSLYFVGYHLYLSLIFFDKIGCRAFIALLAPAMLIGIHITMAVRSGSPIVPVALQGLAYSIYVAVIWPSVPLVVETKYIGTVFGVIISVQNTDLVSFTMIIADIYNGRGQQYLPNV